MADQTFTSGQILTAAQMTTLQSNSGLSFISSTAVGTTVASVTVSNAFSTTYDNYKIIYTGGVMSTTQSVNMTLGSTTSNYSNALVYASYAAGAVGGVGNSAGTSWTFMGYGSTATVLVACDLYQPFLAKNTLMSAPHVQFGGAVAGNNQGILIDTTSYTSFTITPAGGTLTGGTISVYGYRK
jgi:hypothetical protein